MSDPQQVPAYVGLGGNLGQPISQVSQALLELSSLPDSELIVRSSLYQTRPVGPADQPDYINAVAVLATGLPAEALLDALQALEARHGRIRHDAERWGARTLDLDLLLYGDAVIASPRLQVPHPRMCQRAFVLYPLAEVAPKDLYIPGCGPLTALLERVPENGVERLK
jgi:2-amino-4-hydroxy-6-hydroxymethyldihydropteridine diphosphokinase